MIGAEAVADAQVLALEVGFHAEHPSIGHERCRPRPARAQREEVAARDRAPRRSPGRSSAGPTSWRRLSETWPDPDLGDPGLAFELGACLTDYITAIEPLLRKA